jgi:hypothetical protein
MIAGVQQRGLIVKFHSFIQHAIMVAASVLLAACGGGATTNPNQGGPMLISPTEGTFFAGVPSTITISGGRIPYSITSSAPQILPVPDLVNEHSFQVVPNNPAVLTSSTGTIPPTFDVILSFRSADSGGAVQTITIHVAQNFLTGYKVTFTTNCPSGQACAGGQTAVTLEDALNGTLSGNRQFRFTVLRGPFSWVFPNGSTGNSIDLQTDHTGQVRAILLVNTGVPTQLAAFRVQDIATGVYADYVFTIAGTVTPQALTILPNAFDYKAALKGVCGTGCGDVLVFDGQPPYSALASDPNLTVSLPGGTGSQGPVSSSTQPGRFTICANNPNICLNPGTVVITDANLGRGTVTVKTEEGSGTPPPPPLSVSPAGITLNCGQTSSVTVVGGSGTSYSTSTTDPNLTLTGTGNTLSIKRNGNLPVLPGGNQTSTVQVTDGTTIVTIAVSNPVNCSP